MNAHSFRLAALVAAAAGCIDVIRGDRSAGRLTVTSLQGLSGAGGSPQSPLLSDVLVLRQSPAPCPRAVPHDRERPRPGDPQPVDENGQ
jgi:hypothetical protein